MYIAPLFIIGSMEYKQQVYAGSVWKTYPLFCVHLVIYLHTQKHICILHRQESREFSHFGSDLATTK